MIKGIFWRKCIVIVRSFPRLLKLHKLAVGRLDLSRAGPTWCHGVLDHGLILHRNIPLKLGRERQRIEPCAFFRASTKTDYWSSRM